MLCNGPSLNQVDFPSIALSQYRVFGLNKIYLGLDRFDLKLDYFVAVNAKVIEQSIVRIDEIDAIKFISNRASTDSIKDVKRTRFINTTRPPLNSDRFSKNIEEYVNEGFTVTYVALQIIWYMGFEQVYLVGMDHKFSLAKGAEPNSSAFMLGADEDHFDKSYFGYGRSWDLPDLANSEIYYQAALDTFNGDNRFIADCTISGECQVFPKLPIEEALYGRNRASIDKPSVCTLLLEDSDGESLIASINTALTGSGSFEKTVLVLSSTLMNDHSQLIDRWSSIDSRLRCFRESTPVRLSKLLRTAVGLTDADYVSVLHSSDFQRAGSLEKRLRYLESNPEAAMAWSDSSIVDCMDNHLLLPGLGYSCFPDLPCSLLSLRLSGLCGRRIAVEKFVTEVDFDHRDDIRFWIGLLRSRFDLHVVRNIGDRITLRTPGHKQYNSETWSLSSQKSIPRGMEGPDAIENRGDVGAEAESGDERRLLLDRYVVAWLHSVFSDKHASEPDHHDEQCIEKLLVQSRSEELFLQLNEASISAAQVNLLSAAQIDGSQLKRLKSRLRRALPQLEEKQMESLLKILDSKLFAIGPYQRIDKISIDETNVVAAYSRSLDLAERMVDVGAHFGSSIKPFLDGGWKVTAFEPNEQNHARLQEFIERHSSKYAGLVKIEKLAVGAESENSVPFYVSDVSTGISGLSKFHDSHVQDGTASVVSLTDYFAGLPKLDVGFLKIDTEGFDKFVLDGWPWHKGKPAVIECEFEDRKSLALGYDFLSLVELLVSRDYKVFVSEWHPIVEYGKRHSWKGLKIWPCALSDEAAWGNIIAFRGDIDCSRFVRCFDECLRQKNDVLRGRSEPAADPEPLEKMNATSSSRDDTAPKTPGAHGAQALNEEQESGEAQEERESTQKTEIEEAPEENKNNRERQNIGNSMKARYSERPERRSPEPFSRMGERLRGMGGHLTLFQKNMGYYKSLQGIFAAGGLALFFAVVSTLIVNSEMHTELRNSALFLLFGAFSGLLVWIAYFRNEMIYLARIYAEDKVRRDLNAIVTNLGEVNAAQDNLAARQALLSDTVENLDSGLDTITERISTFEETNANTVTEIKTQVLRIDQLIQVTSHLRDDLRSDAGRINELEKQSRSVSQSVVSQEERIDAFLSKADGLAEALQSTTERMDSIEQAARALEEGFVSDRKRINSITQETIELEQSLESDRKRINVVEEDATSFEQKLRSGTERFGDIEKQILEVAKEIEAIKQRQDQDLEKVETSFVKDLEKSLRDKIDSVQSELRNLAISKRDSYLHFSRDLSETDYVIFLETWSEALSLKLSRRQLDYIASTIRQVESNCIGRLATSIQDAILRVLVAHSIEKDNLAYLEIGVLFGVNVCTINELCQNKFESLSISVIDPFEGYYANGNPDIVTNFYVNRKSFIHNLVRSDIDPSEVSIFQGLSTDKKVLKQAKLVGKLDMLLIDGDHSYEGVKFDVDHYSDLLGAGGIMIIDDYGTSDWPEITRYVDEELKDSTDFDFLGASWRSALFRRN